MQRCKSQLTNLNNNFLNLSTKENYVCEDVGERGVGSCSVASDNYQSLISFTTVHVNTEIRMPQNIAFLSNTTRWTKSRKQETIIRYLCYIFIINTQELKFKPSHLLFVKKKLNLGTESDFVQIFLL